ncbi:MAG: hypothetical protein ACK4SY_03725 [Pyrobaculum sp.]
MEIQKLLEVRKALEEKIAQLQKELALYTTLMEVLDRAIGERSFTTPQRPEATEEIKGKTGEVYATVSIYGDHLYVKFRQPIKVEGLFKRFFLDKFLQKYREEDAKDARQGAIRQEEILRYELEESDGEATAVRIYNYRSEERKREILRVLRWTLEKVFSS